MASRAGAAPTALRQRGGQDLYRRTLTQRLRLAGLGMIGRFYQPGVTRLADGSPRSLLLIRPDHLGDMLFLTPGLHALRAALPGTHLTMLAGPWGADALRGSPDVDEIRLCRFPGFERRPKASALAPYRLLAEAASALRAASYDTAVVLRNDHWWGAWLAAAAGVPRRVGYNWPETRPFLTEVVGYHPARHEVQQNAALLEVLAPGISTDLGPLSFSIDARDAAWASAWLHEHRLDTRRPLVAIHPGAGAAVKQWPVEAWVALAQALAEEGFQLLLTGGPSETRLVQSITSSISPPAPSAAGQTTLGQLAALQSHCALVIGSDSGPLHLAVAAGVPTLHLYGPVSLDKFGPWGSPDRQRAFVSGWACVPCNRLDWHGSALGYHRCMEAIRCEPVLAAAREMLSAFTD